MKWKANWWGITLIAETTEDADLVRKLAEKLSEEPDETYDGGKLETENMATDAATIVFNR